MKRLRRMLLGSALLIGSVSVGIVLLADPQAAVADLSGQLETAPHIERCVA